MCERWQVSCLVDNPLAAAAAPWHDPGMSESNTTPATSKTHYSIAEAARLKGVHPNTVRKYIRQGRIKAETIQGPYGVEYAIPEAELDSLGVSVIDTAQGIGHRLRSGGRNQDPGGPI